MQAQTIFQAGNSNVIAIPKDLMKDLGFKKGQKVYVDKSPQGDSIVVKKLSKSIVGSKKSPVNAEFKKWLKEAIREDAQILDELAVR